MDGMPGCAYCGREEPAEGAEQLLLEVSRVSAWDDGVNETVDLEFCGQAHAAAYLSERELAWPEPDLADDTTSGLWAGRLFLGIGLAAIVLSAVGLVAVVRWLL